MARARTTGPRPDEGFGGVIGPTISESTPWWPAPAHPGPDAPDVVVILLDDLGFAHFGCFGSDLDTPHVDALAAGGLRFTDFHVTPVCSPTRAALLTGRNHHTVGMRAVSNFNTGFPNMRGKVTDRATTMAEVLRDAGYASFAVGKWHLTPMHEASAAGPFDSWPLQRGFDRFYGFLDGETDQFSPDLVCDNHRIDPPSTPEAGYHLSEDLVDQAIAMVHGSVSIRPDRPFFTYLALGATHAPHQAPEAHLARQRGRHDHGWDVARARWFARQKELGVIGDAVRLAPRNPGVAPWDSLPDDDRRLAIRLQEAFAAFLEHTDAQIGRLVEALRRLGRLDNTLLMVLSDNGASQEGGPFGVLHEMKFFNGVLETPDRAVAHLDEIGGPRSHANYPWGWAQAGNTPFKWYKQNTHEGGVHVPLVVHWPDGIRDPGGLRDDFAYVTDLAPTVFDVVGVTAPETHRGVPQLPVTGRSLAPLLSGETPNETGRVQYFEMMGHRALYLDGWKAVTRHQPGVPFDDDVWELYHLEVDRSECDDRAAAEPDRLAAMIDRWWTEAAEHGVLPLDDRTVELFGVTFAEHTPHPPSRRYTYHPPLTTLPAQVAAPIAGRSWDLAAVVDRSPRQDGVLYAVGNGNAGLSLFVDGDQLVFDYNAFGEHTVVESTAPVPAGRSVLGVQFRRVGPEADVTLVVDGRDAGRGHIPFVMRIVSSVGASVGHDQRLAVSERHEGPFPFAGTLHRIDIALVDTRRSPDPEQAAAEARSAMGRQ